MALMPKKRIACVKKPGAELSAFVTGEKDLIVWRDRHGCDLGSNCLTREKRGLVDEISVDDAGITVHQESGARMAEGSSSKGVESEHSSGENLSV